MAGLPRVDGLQVCGGSGELLGTVEYGDAAAAYEQRCRWTACLHGGAAWHEPRTTLPEPPGDFPTCVELCYCCAAEVIPSGSRFSSFYCDECRAAVIALRDSCGMAVIPLGRHSIMNGISLRGTEARDTGRLEAFARATLTSFQRMDRVLAWQRVVVSDRVEVIAAGAPFASARAYLAHTGEASPSKREMFRQLCRYLGFEAPPGRQCEPG